MNHMCAVIQDVLPLYIDDVTSIESRDIIDEHLEQCSDCKKVHTELTNQSEKLKTTALNQNLNDKSNIKKLNLRFKKFGIRSVLKGMTLALIIVFVVYGVITVFYRYYFISTPMNEIEISNQTDLGNGDIFYCINYQKGQFYSDVSSELTNDGALYTNLLLPIIKSNNPYSNGCRIFQRGEYEAFYNQSIQQYSLGSPSDAILIWKEGMVFPSPSTEIAMIMAESGYLEIALKYLP